MKVIYHTPKAINDRSASCGTAHEDDSRSCFSEFMSIQPLTCLSSQEPRRDDDPLRAIRRKCKATTQASFQCSSGRHKIQNRYPTKLQLPFPYHVSCNAKDKLCMTCSEKGHNSHDCPMKDQEENLICTICNKVGHCYFRCCRQNVSENHACRRCGEKGHYSSREPIRRHDNYTYMGLTCSSCDTNHLHGTCPMSKITCFLCERDDHVPAQCHLSSILATVNQHRRESFGATLKPGRTVTPDNPPSTTELRDSHECQLKGNNEMTSVTCDGKSPLRTKVPTTVPATMTPEPLTPASGFTCLDYHEDKGHYASSSKNEPPRELEPYGCNQGCQSKGCSEMVPDVSSINHGVQEQSCDRMSPIRNQIPACENTNPEAMRDVVLTSVVRQTCFNCHGEGHWAKRCPKKKAPKKMKRCGVTCLNCNGNHYTIRCPKKKKPGELKLCDVTCLRCHNKGHFANRCPKKHSGSWSHMMTTMDVNCDRRA